MNTFETLYKIDCREHSEERNGLTYLSWPYAWAELKKRFPKSFYTIYENKDGLVYHTDGKTCWVKTGVTLVDDAESLEHIEYLPVMDHRNKSIPVEAVTSFDVNKAIQRSLTKAVARHGLGLYIYAGEDLPEGDPPKCTDCGKEIKGTPKASADKVAAWSVSKYGRALCAECSKDEYARQEASKAGGMQVVTL